MSVNNNYPQVPSNYSVTENYIRKIVLSVNLLMSGKSNNVGEVTLTPSATTTTVSDNNVNPNSAVILQPITEHAADHFVDTWVIAGDKSFVIHHNNNSQTDRTFKYIVVG